MSSMKPAPQPTKPKPKPKPKSAAQGQSSTRPTLAAYLDSYDHLQNTLINQRGAKASRAQSLQGVLMPKDATKTKHHHKEESSQNAAMERYMAEYDQFKDFLVTQHDYQGRQGQQTAMMGTSGPSEEAGNGRECAGSMMGY